MIGKGASAVCYLVQKDGTDEIYVVKQLQIPLEELANKQGFADEVKVMSRFQHPCIVALIDSYIEGDKLHILMEYADGGDL